MPGQMTVCDPTEALAVVGLFLRTRSTFVAWATPETGPLMQLNRGLYFWVGTRALLPAGWRWFSYCAASDAGDPHAPMTFLAQSLFQRVARALRKRDSLMLNMSSRQDNDVAEDALTDLDHVLVLLVGAFDVLARVAHRSTSPSGAEKQAGWRRDDWLKKLTVAAPDLGALAAEGTEGADLLKVLSILRNTVHGPALQALGLAAGPRRRGTGVSLPASETEALVEVLMRRGWDQNWGLAEFDAGRFHATPDLIVEHVLQAAIPLMNAMMVATPVERLVTADATPSLDAPPSSDDLNDPFAARHQESLRWQLGFTVPIRPH